MRKLPLNTRAKKNNRNSFNIMRKPTLCSLTRMLVDPEICLLRLRTTIFESLRFFCWTQNIWHGRKGYQCHLPLRINTSSKDQKNLIYAYIMLKIEMPFNY